MKTFKYLFIFFFLCSVGAQAQYGRPGMPGYGGYGGSGMQNGMMNGGGYPGGGQRSTKPSAEDLEKERTNRIEKYMDKLQTELSLDELQHIAIKNELDANSKRIDIIMKKEKQNDEKAKDIQNETTKLYAEINNYLNEDQKQKFKQIIANREAGIKDKPNKKEKHKKEESNKDEKLQEENNAQKQ